MEVKLMGLLKPEITAGKLKKSGTWNVDAMKWQERLFSIQNSVLSYFEFQILYSWIACMSSL
jgi:hypothetical protein